MQHPGAVDTRNRSAQRTLRLAITLHANAAAWRREQLCRVPLAPALAEL